MDGIVDVIAQTKFFSKIVQKGGIYENKTRGGEEEGLRVNVFREETIFRSQTEVYYIYISRHIVTSAGLIFFRYEASIYTLCLSSVALAPSGQVAVSVVSPNWTRRKNARYADIKVLVLNIRGGGQEGGGREEWGRRRLG